MNELRSLTQPDGPLKPFVARDDQYVYRNLITDDVVTSTVGTVVASRSSPSVLFLKHDDDD